MYYYFNSNHPSAIKLNGAYLGVISDAHRHVNIISDNTFVELCPLSINHPPVSFILNDDFLCNPPSCVSVVDMKGGYFITFNVPSKNCAIGILEQKKFNCCLATAFNDCTLKISLETPNDFFAFCPKETPSSIEFSELSNEYICAILTLNENSKTIYVFSVKQKIRLLFTANANDVNITNGIILVDYKQDVAKHVVTTTYAIQNDEVVKTDVNVKCKTGFNVASLDEKILPYAFLEEYLVGGDYTQFLSDTMLQNANKLSYYLGDFVGVMPPPIFRNYDEIGLVKKIKDNVYKIDYVKVMVQNKKIDNISFV